MANNNSTSPKEKRRILPRWLSTPFLVFVAAIVVICFVKENNYMRARDNMEQIAHLRKEIQLNLDSAAYFNNKVHELNTNHEQLERVAREQYHMKRDNEDVYITDIK